MLSYRKFNDESDYEIMRSIVRGNCTKTGHLYPQLHIGNLDFERFAYEENPDILYKTAWLVFDDNTEIGFIMAYEDEFYITVSTGFEHLMTDIFEYMEHNCYIHGTHVTTDANSEDTLLSSILEQRGYTKTGTFRFNGICELSTILPCTPLIDGLSMRLMQKSDLERRVELFGLATGGHGTSKERYERMMKSPSYNDAMDLVVQLDNKKIIAYCTVWNDPVSRTAILEPVACVQEYRRKGIMKSTLLYGMNQLKQQGTKYIYVGTGGSNSASQALYRSVGFVEYGRNYEWEKVI